MKIGVLALQGGVSEHIYMVRAALNELGISGEAIKVSSTSDVKNIDGLIIPGGESTTIQRLMVKLGLWNIVKELIIDGLPVLGTCAGAILLAKSVKDREVEEPRVETLGTMSIEVVRNYFGRQKESFESDIKIPILGEQPFRAVFIRAPAITRVNVPARPLAQLNDVIVAAVEDVKLVTTFHPELSKDLRLHMFWLQNIHR
ncbi:MAG: pyridoxal 5'-phosphate synthase glutaminase subunit PdxT [Candidatus Nezhaarchaeota archaeon]|nr:pyridoxal 5'-phosphate synthase glutaminase subunit PdxT [Candidatus Nezhaarchaeota archaeon]